MGRILGKGGEVIRDFKGKATGRFDYYILLGMYVKCRTKGVLRREIRLLVVK